MARPRTTPVRQRKNKNPDLPHSTLSQERVSYLPLGEGGPAGPEEGRYQVRPKFRPTPVPGCARSTLSQERVFSLPRSTLS